MSYSLLGPTCVFKDVSISNTKFFKLDSPEYKPIKTDEPKVETKTEPKVETKTEPTELEPKKE